MVNTLSGTNNDIAIAAAELKSTLLKLNSSTALWSLLNDESLVHNLSTSMSNLRSASARADNMIGELNNLVLDVKSGKGSLGAVLTDTVLADNLNEAIVRVRQVADQADTLAKELSLAVSASGTILMMEKGLLTLCLKIQPWSLHKCCFLENIRESTQHFNEVMEGLKHSFPRFEGISKGLKKAGKGSIPTSKSTMTFSSFWPDNIIFTH